MQTCGLGDNLQFMVRPTQAYTQILTGVASQMPDSMVPSLDVCNSQVFIVGMVQSRLRCPAGHGTGSQPAASSVSGLIIPHQRHTTNKRTNKQTTQAIKQYPLQCVDVVYAGHRHSTSSGVSHLSYHDSSCDSAHVLYIHSRDM